MPFLPVRAMILPLAIAVSSPYSFAQVQRANSQTPVTLSPKPTLAVAQHSGRQSGKQGEFLVQSPATQEYEIRLLQAPSNVGDRARLVSQDSTLMTSKIVLGDRVEQKVEKSALALVADVTVLTVNSEKQATSLSLEVIQSKATQDNAETVPFREGTTIVASIQNGKTVFTINGDGVEEQLAESLSNIVDFNNTGESDDAAFGTSTPKRIGESWSINPVYLAESFPDVNPQNIRGTMTLNDVIDGFLLISGLVQIDNALSSRLPPNQFTVEKDEALLELSLRSPIDTNNKDLDRTLRFTGSIHASAKMNSSVRMEITSEATTSWQIRGIE